MCMCTERMCRSALVNRCSILEISLLGDLEISLVIQWLRMLDCGRWLWLLPVHDIAGRQ